MFNQLAFFQQIALVVILFLNIYTLILYYVDKQRAIKNNYRIPEKTLLISAFALGGIGAGIGMFKFRHKTKHPIFKLSVPVATFITSAVIYFVFNYST